MCRSYHLVKKRESHDIYLKSENGSDETKDDEKEPPYRLEEEGEEKESVAYDIEPTKRNDKLV